MSAFDLIRNGGEWLMGVRSWIQSHKLNGDTVKWASNEVLRPAMTVAQVEEAAAEAAAAHGKELARQNRLLRDDLIAARDAFKHLSQITTDKNVQEFASDHWFKLFSKDLT
jgi:hypothetical protein